MKSVISFSDLRDQYIANVNEINEINKANIDWKSIIESKKKAIQNYEVMISAIQPDNVKDFEKNSKEYMEKIASLENEIQEDEKKAGRKQKLIDDSKKILEEAKKRKESLEKEVEDEYKENKKDDEKVSPDVKKAREELANYKSQLEKMERDEVQFPNKVKDSKYKEFLNRKIQEKTKFLEENDKSSAEEIKEFELNEIKEEYMNFKMAIARIEKPVELQKPNPVLEKAKEVRRVKEEEKKKNPLGKKNRNVVLPKDVKISIGRKGTITFNGIDYIVAKKDIKKGLNLTEEETMSLINENLNVKDEIKEYMKEAIKNKIIDSTVINAVCSTSMTNKDKKDLLKQYIMDGLRAKNGSEYKNNCNISYDKKDLSKASLFARIFKREINASEKVEMLDRASVGERYAIARQEGEYKPDRISRIVGFVTRTKVPLLSDKISSLQEVATAYNELRDNGKTKTHKEFEHSLKANVKHLSKEQVQEMDELHKSQTKQEEMEH